MSDEDVTEGKPWDLLREANNDLFFGNKEGAAGRSVFRTVLVVGTVMILDPETRENQELATYGAFNAREDDPEAIGALLVKLQEMQADIAMKLLEAVERRRRKG